MSSNSSVSLFQIRRAAAELLALAVKELFPNVLLVGGDVTDTGFFYDFVFEQPVLDESLALLEIRIRALIKEELEICSLSMMRENGHSFFMHHGQPFLADHSLQADQNIVSLIQIENFYDLCASLSSLTSTGQIGHVKLLEKQKMDRLVDQEEEKSWISVTRFIGTAFSDFSSLKKFNKAYDQLKKKDHRILGPELDLFSFIDQAGEIECFWHPKGEILRNILIKLWLDECKNLSIQFVKTPLLVKQDFCKKKYVNHLFFIEDQDYLLNGSRFFQHLALFVRKKVSISQLPLRLAEWTQEYRQEEEAKLWGLFRAYSFESDQLTIFCSEEQVIPELISSLQFFEKIITILGFEGQWCLTASEQEHPKRKRENLALEWLTSALDRCQQSYLLEVHESSDIKEPEIEFRFKDRLGRFWKGPSIEVKVHSVGGMKLNYEAENGEQKAPVVLTRTIFSSLDRLIGLLIEQYEGNFPLWLAPEQIRVISIGSQSREYAEGVYQSCVEKGYRVQLDSRSDKLGAKVHEAQREKVPYLLIIGDKEENKKLVTVRSFQKKNESSLVSLETFFENFDKECDLPS
jgi:threonyl-tRNA synthetase